MSQEEKKSLEVDALPAHESGVRRLVADASNQPYVALESFDQARACADAVVILEGDYGGQIYVVAPIGHVKCDLGALNSLLADLDSLEWADPEGARIFFERLPVGAGVSGGMGGAFVGEGIWVHDRLKEHNRSIVAVLAGERERLVP